MPATDFYQPFQRLDKYVYQEIPGITSIVSSLQVWLHVGEYIIVSDAVETSPFHYEIQLQVTGQKISDGGYLWEGSKEIPVNTTPVTSKASSGSLTEEAIITQVRSQLHDLLSDSPGYVFWVKAIIKYTDGQTGGSVTNTIDENQEIDIK